MRTPGFRLLPPRWCLPLALVTAPALAQSAATIPRTWADAEVASFELPLALPEFSPRHVSEDYYYRLPVRPVWRTYPIYHPDHEPDGYRDWLAAREPQVVFDEAAAQDGSWRDADWIAAGADVFRAPIVFNSSLVVASDLRDPEWYEHNDIALTTDGEFPFARWVVRQKGVVEVGMFSCATCHTRRMPDGTVIEGAQGNIPLPRIIADRLRRGEVSVELVRTIAHAFEDAPWRDSRIDAMSREELLRTRAALPPGVLPRQGTTAYAPVRVPDLIGIRERKYLDATGLVRHRGIGDLMRYAASNQGMDMLARFGDFVPATRSSEVPPPGKSRFPGTGARYSDAQLYALARFLYALEPPRNPHPLDADARRGREVFAAAHCGGCHPPPLYTDNKLVAAPGFEPPADHRERYDVSRRRVGTDPSLATDSRRGTGYYKVPSLQGLWYRGPLGHSGECATLEDWFDARRLQDDYVPTGFAPADGSPRAVRGHEFGLDLSADDKRALIAFLRTL